MTQQTIEIKAIAAAAMPYIESILNHFLPGGKYSCKEYQCSDLTGGNGDSFSFNTTTGKWADFATGDKGGDVVALIAAILKCSQLDAAKEVAGFIGHTSTSTAPPKAVKSEVWTAIIPVPTDAPPAPTEHFKHGAPKHIYEYKNMFVHRYEFPPDNPTDKNKKIFSPLTYCRNESGKAEWRFQALPGDRPLYGLEFLTDTTKFVLGVEGEEAVKAARRLVGDKMPVVTFSGGSNAVSKTDFSPLKGLRVCYWPDADAPGSKAALLVSDAVMKAGAVSVKIVIPSAGVVAGWDAADAESDGWTREQVMQLLTASVTPDEFKAAVMPAPDAVPPTADNCDEWPEPLLFGEIDTPEVTADDTLPEPLAGFCNAVSGSTQTPPGMAVMMGLATVSTCLQKRFEVCPFGDSYTEPVNLMVVVGAEPATRKSAVTKAMTEPLTIWEMEQADRLKDVIVQTRHTRDMLIKSIDSIKSTASKPGATDAERKEALTEIKRLEDSMPPEITAPKLWVDDVNVERLQGLMESNGERIAIISAEGGVFEVLAGLYSGGKSNVNIVLQGHAGEPVRVERQGRSVTMLKPALTFGLMVQPSIISDLAAGNKARFRGNGMLARLLYCLPKSTVGTRDVTKRRPIPNEISTKYNNLINRLLAIQPLSDETGRECARILTLAPDALKAWLIFSQYIESKQGQYGEFHSIQDWTGKLPGAALRIAGLCHVVEHGESVTVISKATIERALDLAQMLIVHAKAAFDLMGSDPAIPDAKFVLQWITKNGADSFRRGDLHKATHGRFQRVDRLIAALRVLTERNIISEPQDRPTGRRPEIIYTVNPAILKGGF